MAGYRYRRGATAAALLLGAVVTGLLSGCDEEGSAATTAAPPPPTVTTASPLVMKLTEWDEFTGRFEPVDQVEVRPRVEATCSRSTSRTARSSSRASCCS